MTTLHDELLAIRERHGALTPQVVVDTARDPHHPLHSRFEWDDGVAAELHRREQARALIRKVRITYREATETEAARTVRAFHAVPNENGMAYEPIEEVVNDPIKTQILMNSMAREWKAMRRRYGHFQEFWQMVEADRASQTSEESA